MTLRYIPSSWNEPAFDIYCDPTAAFGAGAGGAGTSVSPYTDLRYALITGLSNGESLGIRTGRTVDASAYTNNDLAHTAALMSVTTKSGILVAAWRPTGAPDTPSVLTSAFLFGTSAINWEQVSLADQGAGVVATNNVYVASSTSGIWHYTGTIHASTNISGLGFGSRYSISDQVTASNYKQHGCASPHTECAYLDDSGTHAIINTSAGESNPLTEDMTWCFTVKGGLIINSGSNPATRWGGVYGYVSSIPILQFLDCQDATFHYAWQVDSGSCILVLKNTLDQVMDVDVRGVWGSHVGRVLTLLTDNLSPSFGGANFGSVDITAGTNNVVFNADASQPWITADISDIKADNLYAKAFTGQGWVKNTLIHDIDIDLSNLQADGGLSVFPMNAPLGSHNQLYDFHFTRIHCGAGKFGRTDWGVSFAAENGGFSLHHGIFEECAGTVQLDGARRNQTCYNVLFKNVLKGPHMSDEMDDGSGSRQVVNCGVILDDPANWRIASYGDGSFGSERWDIANAYSMHPDVGHPAKGHALDTDVMSNNDGDFFTNNWWSLGACPAASAYGLRNGTIGANAIPTAWDDSVTSGGHTANDGLGRNGEAVTIGQAQVRAQKLATVVGLSHDSSSTSTKRIVANDYSDASATQTVSSIEVSSAQALTAEGFWTASSPSNCRIGGTVLNATTVDTVIDYTRVAVNTNDLRYVPRWGNVASLGPYQYIPLAPTTRTGLTA